MARKSPNLRPNGQSLRHGFGSSHCDRDRIHPSLSSCPIARPFSRLHPGVVRRLDACGQVSAGLDRRRHARRQGKILLDALRDIDWRVSRMNKPDAPPRCRRGRQWQQAVTTVVRTSLTSDTASRMSAVEAIVLQKSKVVAVRIFGETLARSDRRFA